MERGERGRWSHSSCSRSSHYLTCRPAFARDGPPAHAASVVVQSKATQAPNSTPALPSPAGASGGAIAAGALPLFSASENSTFIICLFICAFAAAVVALLYFARRLNAAQGIAQGGGAAVPKKARGRGGASKQAAAPSVITQSPMLAVAAAAHVARTRARIPLVWSECRRRWRRRGRRPPGDEE